MVPENSSATLVALRIIIMGLSHGDGYFVELIHVVRSHLGIKIWLRLLIKTIIAEYSIEVF